MGNLIKALNIACNLGFIIALPAIIFVLLGAFLDKILQTKPMLTIIFSLLGAGAGFYFALKENERFLKDKK